MSVPRILYVVSTWPGASAFGAQQRVLSIGRLLHKIGTVSLIVVDAFGEEERWRDTTATEFKVAGVVKVQSITANRISGRLRQELDPRYLDTVPSASAAHPTDRQAVLDLARQHDVVWVHTINVANLLGIYQWPHSVLDVDDIRSRVYESLAKARTSFVRRMLDQRMSLIWKRRERTLAERFDVLMVCSENDRRYLGMDDVHVLPNGFERVATIERSPSQPPRIGFIGPFPRYANVEGVRWFCACVWPRIKKQVPDACLRVVGEYTEVASEWGEGIEGIGRLDDVGSEIGTWSTMIVPIRIGGGTRIKVLEGFARRCPVVSTSLGAFGYDIQDGEEAFLADEPHLFAQRCLELIGSPRVADRMADCAYRRFLNCWTWESYEPIVRSAVELAMRTDAHSLAGVRLQRGLCDV